MRLGDWNERFDALVDGCALRKFQWGAQDCITFGADAVKAITGRDPLADMRGVWTDERAAARMLRDHGGMRCAITSRMGEPIDPSQAGVGDLALVLIAGREMLCVLGRRGLLAPGPVGMVSPSSLSTERLCAWRVE